MKQSKYILLVDDDEDDQDLFSEALSVVDSSFDLLWADSGASALSHLTQNTPPVPEFIFLDLNMPRLNGFELLSEIKKQEKLSEVPVVVYTTSANTEHKRKMSDLGANHYMVKQHSFRQLCQELEQVLTTP